QARSCQLARESRGETDRCGKSPADLGAMPYHSGMSRRAGGVVGAVVRRADAQVKRVRRWWSHRTLPSFATPAEGFEMQHPRTITNPAAIHVGTAVKLGPGS